MNQLILTTAYLGSVQYYTKFLSDKKIFIEQHDSYHKQTFRNRCQILGANGELSLTIPIIKKSGKKTLVKDTKIDYTTRWQSNHWRSIVSAYNSSPFFEYYEADFAPFYQKEWKFLFDFNMELHLLISDFLELENTGEPTSNYIKKIKGDDLRFTISPKKQISVVDDYFRPKSYTQTFHEKFGFIPNLSIIDLLFNCGSESRLTLEKSSNSEL